MRGSSFAIVLISLSVLCMQGCSIDDECPDGCPTGETCSMGSCASTGSPGGGGNGGGGSGGDGGAGGMAGGGGLSALSARCLESNTVYCTNGYDCRDGGWSVSAGTFTDFYKGSLQDCLDAGDPCTTEEAYCEERDGGTYSEANHEACIAGQAPNVWNCPVDELDLPIFPPECELICVP